jgi:hypothetical protein
VRQISTNARSDKRLMRPPTGHFKKHLEEVCPNHMYPISHRFKDYGMMTSFMTSGSLTWGIELDEGLDGGPYDAISQGKCHHEGLRGMSRA